MVEYTDIPAVNALYEEQARINQGIAIIDAGGTVSSFTLIPAPPSTSNPNPSMLISTTIGAVDPSLEFLASVRKAMVDRNAVITQELTDLGVSGSYTAPNPTSGGFGYVPPSMRGGGGISPSLLVSDLSDGSILEPPPPPPGIQTTPDPLPEIPPNPAMDHPPQHPLERPPGTPGLFPPLPPDLEPIPPAPADEGEKK